LALNRFRSGVAPPIARAASDRPPRCGSDIGPARVSDACAVAERTTALARTNRNAANGAVIPCLMPLEWGGFWTSY
jgi:hypothetical protein